jgi:hypothetical protein
MRQSSGPRSTNAVAFVACFALGATACTTSTEEANTPKAPVAARAPTHEEAILLDGLTASNPDLVTVAAKIAASGDTAVTKRAARTLVSLAESEGSREWREAHKGEFRAEKASPAALTDDRAFERELDAFQIEHITPIYAAMDALGGDVIVDHALRAAGDKTASPERRRLALTVLEHHVDRADSLHAPAVASLETELNKLAQSQRAKVPEEEAAKVVAIITPGVHDCVKQAIQTKPNLETKGILTLNIAGDGSVSDSTVSDLSPPDLAKCIEDAGRKARFEPTSSGVAFTLRIPMNFHPR